MRKGHWLVGLLACLCGLLLAAFADAAETIPVEVSAELKTPGEPTRLHEKKAETMALRKALEQVAGDVIEDKARLSLFLTQLKTMNLEEMSSLVPSRKILRFNRRKGFYRVYLEAQVDVDALASWQPGGGQGAAVQRVRVMVIIPEDHEGRGVAYPAGEAELIQMFLDSGITVVDQDIVAGLRGSSTVRQALASSDFGRAVALAKEHGADVLVIGKASSARGQASRHIMGNMTTCRAQLRARVVDCHTGKVYAAKSAEAGGFDLASDIAAGKAVRSAVKDMAGDLLEEVIEVARALSGPEGGEDMSAIAARPKPKPPERPRHRGPIGDRWAVVVGVSTYQTDSFSTLRYAAVDAKAFAAKLQELGWCSKRMRVLLDTEATKANLEFALENWLTQVKENDLILLFWAGHGYPDLSKPERVYFACHDTNADMPSSGLRMDRVRDMLEERNAQNVVMIADSCHAGKIITRGERGIGATVYVKSLERKQDVPGGWIFMVGAATSDQAVEHAEWSNGAFTYCLLKGLGGEADGRSPGSKKDGNVTMGELRDYVLQFMPEETFRVIKVAKHPVIIADVGDPAIWDFTLAEGK